MLSYRYTLGGQTVQVFQSFLEAIMTIYVIFGSRDPEAEKARELCREYNVPYGQATSFLNPLEVGPADAYNANGWQDEAGELRPEARVLLFECDGKQLRFKLVGVNSYTWLDHHRPGDRGWGKPPAQFWPASSLGQLAAELARAEILRGDAYTDAEGTPLGVSKWDESSGTWRVAARHARWWTVPTHYLYAAAADHCLAAAYRGECPGVDPDQLMVWRVKSRAEFQGRPVEALMADVERARQALRQAPKIDLGGEVVADLRGQVVPELPEAAAREGIAFLATPPARAGERRKVVLQCAGSAALAAWRQWAVAQGLVDLYGGDPGRGFAGGYIPA
jgi:hypothetical protein